METHYYFKYIITLEKLLISKVNTSTTDEKLQKKMMQEKTVTSYKQPE